MTKLFEEISFLSHHALCQWSSSVKKCGLNWKLLKRETGGLYIHVVALLGGN